MFINNELKLIEDNQSLTLKLYEEAMNACV